MAYEDITSSSMRLTLVLLLIGFGCFFSGLFDQPTPVQKETLEGLTFAYLQYQGPFTHIPTILNTVTSRLGTYGNSIEAAMFYDNPEDPKIGWNNVRWAAGAIIQPHQKQKAIDSDLEVITLPDVPVIKTRIPHRSPFSVMFSPHKAYPVLASYVEENNVTVVGPAIEIYGDDFLDYLFCVGEACRVLRWKVEGEVYDPVVDPVKERIEPIKEVVMEKVEVVKEKIGEMKEKGCEEMKELKEKGCEKMGEMKEKVKEKIEDMKEKGGEVKEKVGEKVEETKEKGKEGMEDVKEKVVDLGDRTGEVVKEGWEGLKEGGERMVDGVVKEKMEEGEEKVEEVKEEGKDLMKEIRKKAKVVPEKINEKLTETSERIVVDVTELDARYRQMIQDLIHEKGWKMVDGSSLKYEIPKAEMSDDE